MCSLKPPRHISTPPGHFTAWYRYNGERRRIRPWKKEGLPIDLCGFGGLIKAPPSRACNGCYAFVQGGLDDVERLPTLRGLAPDMYVTLVLKGARGYDPRAHDIPRAHDVLPFVPDGVYDHDPGVYDDSRTAEDLPTHIPEGARNQALCRFALEHKRQCGSRELLFRLARGFIDDNGDPLASHPVTDDEIRKVVDWAWNKDLRHENYLAGDARRGLCGLPQHEINRMLLEDRDAFDLLVFLDNNNGRNATFMIANGLVEGPHRKLPLTRKALADARDRLLELGIVRMVRGHCGGQRPQAALYRWVVQDGSSNGTLRARAEGRGAARQVYIRIGGQN
jgi:hypothetical protein